MSPTYLFFANRGGWRLVILFHHGRKWIKLMELSTLNVHTLPIAEQRFLKPYDHPNPNRLTTRLKQRRVSFKRMGIHVPKRAVQASINKLSAS